MYQEAEEIQNSFKITQDSWKKKEKVFSNDIIHVSPGKNPPKRIWEVHC